MTLRNIRRRKAWARRRTMRVVLRFQVPDTAQVIAAFKDFFRKSYAGGFRK